MSDKPDQSMLGWREPETPEEQAAFDNFCFAIVDGIARSIEARRQEYKPGEVNRARGESSAPRPASTSD